MQKLRAQQISIRAKSKKEMYRILQLKGDVYLPPIQQAIRKYKTEIILGRIKVCAC